MNGLNCQAFVHLLYDDRAGIQLPKGLWSKEIAEDTGIVFRSVDPDQDGISVGDVFVFRRKSNDPRRFHLAVSTGAHDHRGDIQLIHANSLDGGVSVWPFRDFFQRGRYNELACVKRLIPELHDIFLNSIQYGNV